MEKLLTSYLFQTRSCPLAGLGSLWIKPGEAVSDFGNKQITAPVAIIHFTPEEIDAEGLLTYLANKTNSGSYEVTAAFDHFCDSLKDELTAKGSVKLNDIGNFSVDTSGNIIFVQDELPAFFLPAVTADRVVHPAAEHNLLVGDKESTNTLMAEYFNESPVIKDRWWIWAIVLAVIAIGIIAIYINDSAASSLFGNAVTFDKAY